MFKIWKKHSINQINIIAIFFAGIFAFSSAFVIIFNELVEFDRELIATETNYIQNQKIRTVEQTSRLHRLIKYRFSELKEEPENIIESLITKEIGIVLDDSSNGYIFVYDKHKKAIYTTDGVTHDDKVISDFLDVAHKGGGFFSFKSAISHDTNIDNISFIREFKDLGWIVGSGVSINEIERVLAQKKEEHQKKITGFILKIITLTLFLYLASILKYRYITDKISKEIKFIVNSLKEASKKYTIIDRDKIKFEEFREITSQVNFMIEKIKEKKSELEDLNQNLETLVYEKTKKLKKSVAYSEELLMEQDKFLKNAIHEINTPLTIILMNIELYNLKFEKNPYLLKIEAAIKVLDNIYGDLCFIVKKDKVESTKEMIDFSEFLKSRVDYFADVALGNRLRFDSQIDEDIFILFNEYELQRLCDNNISNAIKYSYINEAIHVRLYKEEENVVFEVENRGDEIESIDKLFDRYYREDIARGGFGLGLNIVKEICEKNSVKIDVQSHNSITSFKYCFECTKN